MSDSVIVKTHNLNKSYKGVTALKSLDLEVSRNSMVGFLGPNGAGKTTAIKLLLGLARPDGGNGIVLGHDIVHQSVDIRKRVGYLAQDPSFYGDMTARETLRFAARFFYSGPTAGINTLVSETLDITGLSDKADRPIKGFSGGERQRLGIGQAYINTPDLLILDEPAASLDPMGRHDVLKLLQQLRDHTTVLYSTHILDDVQRVSDSVVILNRGELIAQAPIDELLMGNSGAVYVITIKGDASAAYGRAVSQPWVHSIDTTQENGKTIWHVNVKEEETAEAQLLRLVMTDEHLTVAEFTRKKYELEDIFINIVTESNNG